MGLRYPLAVLFAWGIFLALVRIWAAREAAHFPVEEQLGEDTLAENTPLLTRSVLVSEDDWRRKSRRDSIWSWLDWLDFTDLFDPDAVGCLAGIAIMVLITLGAGAILTLTGLIGQAEILIAELFLDAVLLSAFSKRLHRLKPQWWVAGVVRQTMWPVLLTALLLMVGGFLLQGLVPDAKSIGGVWRHYHPAPPPAVPQLERER